MTGLLVLAFGAGLLAPVNPCGFGLLPAVLTATTTTSTRGTGLVERLAGGLRAGLALTAGFTATFTVIGLLLKLISDLTYVWVDPRIDFASRES